MLAATRQNASEVLDARWYDAATGQFMSLDPKVTSTLDPYQYVGNDPVNEIDPSGAMVVNIGGCGTKACVKQNNAVANAATQVDEAVMAQATESGASASQALNDAVTVTSNLVDTDASKLASAEDSGSSINVPAVSPGDIIDRGVDDIGMKTEVNTITGDFGITFINTGDGSSSSAFYEENGTEPTEDESEPPSVDDLVHDIQDNPGNWSPVGEEVEPADSIAGGASVEVEWRSSDGATLYQHVLLDANGNETGHNHWRGFSDLFG
jgi:hypothetical protein